MSDQQHALWHESLDRTHCVLQMLDSLVLEHPYVSKNDGLADMGTKAADAVYQLYAHIAHSEPVKADVDGAIRDGLILPPPTAGG